MNKPYPFSRHDTPFSCGIALIADLLDLNILQLNKRLQLRERFGAVDRIGGLQAGAGASVSQLQTGG